MHQDFAQQPTGQMPGITGPNVLDQAAFHEVTEDGIDAIAQPCEVAGKRWVRITRRPAEVKASLAKPPG
jgi:hypothetical protein